MSRSTLDDGVGDGSIDWASQRSGEGDSEEEGEGKGLDGHVENGVVEVNLGKTLFGECAKVKPPGLCV